MATKAEIKEAIREMLPEITAAARVRDDGAHTWLSIPQAAKRCGFGEDAIRDHISAGRLRATLPAGSAHYRIAVADLAAWICAGKPAALSVPAEVDRLLSEAAARRRRKG